MTDFRIGLWCVLPILLLVACGGPGGRSGAAGGGLGVNATGGLLAAGDGHALKPAPAAGITGRLLHGPYLVLLSGDDFERARRAALDALEATPSGQTTIWRNPENGHWGTLTPSRTFLDANGRYCREFRQTVTVDGQEHQGNGSACREPDSVWRVMS